MVPFKTFCSTSITNKTLNKQINKQTLGNSVLITQFSKRVKEPILCVLAINKNRVISKTEKIYN